MSTTKLVIKTRKRMSRIIVGLVLLLIVEFFVIGPFIGPFVFGVMLATFVGGIWLGNRIVDPLLEMGEKAITQSMAQESGEVKGH